MAKASLAANLLGLAGMIVLLPCLSACNAPAQPKPDQPQQPDPVSPQKQDYLVAVNNYNDFIEHPKHHVYNVYPKERKLELCYLAAQDVITSTKVPEFASDLNSDGEINEWRRWIDIREQELHC